MRGQIAVCEPGLVHQEGKAQYEIVHPTTRPRNIEYVKNA
jgi:hypothetical protein